MKPVACLALPLALAVCAAVGAQAPAPLVLSLREAVLLSLERSPALKVQALTVASRQTTVDEEEAAFEPKVTGSASRTWSPRSSSGDVSTDRTDADAGVSALLPPGTSVSAGTTARWADGSSATLTASVTQPLLRGAFTAVNLARVRQARIDRFVSRHELAAYTSTLLADVEIAYWDTYLAGEQLAITRESLSLAERQLEEIGARVAVGRLAEIELAAGQAEVASRREALLTAEGRFETARVRLVRLLNPPGEARWEQEIRLTEKPDVPADDVGDARRAVEVGLRLRPDLEQARLAVERGDLELVRTRNGILPKLDLFLTGTGYGSGDTLGASWSGLPDEPAMSAGLRFEVPLGNRAAEARGERAAISRRQADEALGNLELLAEAEIRTAHIEALRAFRQIEATAVLRGLQVQKLAAETEKFRVGTSTAYLVAQAQRDLLNSQLSAVGASVGYLQALVRLYRSEGTLLQKRGVEIPTMDAAGDGSGKGAQE